MRTSYDIDSLENRDDEAYRRIATFIARVLQPWFRAEVRGLDRIPRGAGMYVGNHNGGLMAPRPSSSAPPSTARSACRRCSSSSSPAFKAAHDGFDLQAVTAFEAHASPSSASADTGCAGLSP